MLTRLEIENFYSIREKQVIDLRAAANAPSAPDRLVPPWQGSDERVPTAVALFGANASGKTNVLKALAFVAWFINDSFFLRDEASLPLSRFHDWEMATTPARLAVHFTAPEIQALGEDVPPGRCGYAYEVQLAGDLWPDRVASEALFCWPRGSSRRIKLFERGGKGEVTAGPAFALGGFAQPLEKILRPSVSVIATLAQLNHPVARAIRAEAAKIRGNVLRSRTEYDDDEVIRHYAETPGLIASLNREISRFDLGIESMAIDNGPAGPRAQFVHPGFAGTIGMASESHGTRQFIKLYPFLLTALDTGGVVVLDELDTAIHPLLLPEILGWFRDADRNPHHAQLWMTCHNPSLLEELIKEEIFFCEKDGRGATAIFGLSDIQSVRRTDNYYRKYLAGLFGAVPHIG